MLAFASFVLKSGDGSRNGVSRKCVPKLSFGTRGSRECVDLARRAISSRLARLLPGLGGWRYVGGGRRWFATLTPNVRYESE